MHQITTIRNKDTITVTLTVPHKTKVKQVLTDVEDRIQNFYSTYTKCPNCELFDTVEEHFGWRTINGKKIPQSWCSKCRSGKEK